MSIEAASEKIVVVGVDDSQSCEAAFYKALPFCVNEPGLALHCVHVRKVDDEYRVDSLFVRRDSTAAEKEQKRKERSLALKEEFAKVASAKRVSFKSVELIGDPREMLCDYCKKQGAELLVIGDRGEGKLKRLMVGTVSDYCVHHAPCSVLIAKASKISQTSSRSGEMELQPEAAA